jgi:Ser/Thr protein kinase RdoA (MazF antagonist)
MTDETLTQRLELPRPDVTAAEAGDILLSRYGLSGTLTELGSQQDRNYRIDTGERRYVLKICHVNTRRSNSKPRTPPSAISPNMPDAPRVPRVVASTDGQDIVAVTSASRPIRSACSNIWKARG